VCAAQEVIQQLQLMGEVVYLKTEAADLICLCPKWLCSTLCGYLLSRSAISFDFSLFISAVCFLQPVIRLGLLLIRKKYRFIFRVYLSEVCLGKRTVVESNCKKKIKCHFIKRNLKKTKVWKQKKLIRSENLQSFAEVFDFPFSGKNKN